jgi:gamma-glutamylcyclotransferase (GGCT)/AIG2-like uncharacterized protein YtfP
MPRMFLNGTAMSGGADHHLVGDAKLVARTTTARRYRFRAVDGRYPALEDVGPDGGVAVEGEVYELSYEQLREVLLPGEPDGLELGVVELADGSGSLAMVLRREYPKRPPTEDISELASWRKYREADREGASRGTAAGEAGGVGQTQPARAGEERTDRGGEPTALEAR